MQLIMWLLLSKRLNLCHIQVTSLLQLLYLPADHSCLLLLHHLYGPTLAGQSHMATMHHELVHGIWVKGAIICEKAKIKQNNFNARKGGRESVSQLPLLAVLSDCYDLYHLLSVVLISPSALRSALYMSDHFCQLILFSVTFTYAIMSAVTYYTPPITCTLMHVITWSLTCYFYFWCSHHLYNLKCRISTLSCLHYICPIPTCTCWFIHFPYCCCSVHHTIK
jgi:hypothetical protein